MFCFFGKFDFLRMLKMGPLVLSLAVFAAMPVFAEEADKTENVAADSTDDSNPLSWFFDNMVQPVFNAAIWPVSQPLHYAFDNGVFETFQDLITFGENRNIFIYPAFNFRPGSSTLIGFNYRHRNVILGQDYYVLSSNFYANGDISFDTHYSKSGIWAGAAS